jgi:hypothetical protein
MDLHVRGFIAKLETPFRGIDIPRNNTHLLGRRGVVSMRQIQRIQDCVLEQGPEILPGDLFQCVSPAFWISMSLLSRVRPLLTTAGIQYLSMSGSGRQPRRDRSWQCPGRILLPSAGSPKSLHFCLCLRVRLHRGVSPHGGICDSGSGGKPYFSTLFWVLPIWVSSPRRASIYLVSLTLYIIWSLKGGGHSYSLWGCQPVALQASR